MITDIIYQGYGDHFEESPYIRGKDGEELYNISVKINCDGEIFHHKDVKCEEFFCGDFYNFRNFREYYFDNIGRLTYYGDFGRFGFVSDELYHFYLYILGKYIRKNINKFTESQLKYYVDSARRIV